MKYFELSYKGSQFQVNLDHGGESIAITHGASTIKFEIREVKDSTMSLPKQISGKSCTDPGMDFRTLGLSRQNHIFI